MERVEARFSPAVRLLPNERLVVSSGLLGLACDGPGQHALARTLLARFGIKVLEQDGPGLTLRFYVQAIEAMTLADRAWEGLPRRADSMQQLIDEAITQSRAERRPIGQLVIIGHAGLPGCAVFGGTPDDCVFKGRLSAYQRKQLARLRRYLAPDAEIELRQCVSGSGQAGQALLTAVHEMTGAGVSAYLADFHFGDSDAHPRIVVDASGVRSVPAKR